MFSGWADRLRHTLSFRLAAWYVGLFIVSSLTVIAVTYFLLGSSLRERDRDAVRALGVRYATVYAQGGIVAIESSVVADRRSGRYEPFLLRIVKETTGTLYLTFPADLAGVDVRRLSDPALTRGRWIELPLNDGETSLDVSGFRLSDGTEMQVGKSSRVRRETLARFRGRALAIATIMLVTAVAGGVVLTHAALTPLRALTGTIQRILETGNLKTRVPVRPSLDPLDAAAGLFNDLLARLDRLVTGMREALDNTAHDLRTPLTRARNRAEAALHGPRDPQMYLTALEDVVEEIDRTSGILTTLMDISEAETGAMRLVRTTVNVREVLAATVDLYADTADARRITLTMEAPGELSVQADENRLRQVVANVVDNAIKYTPEGGRVLLKAQEHAGAVAIHVQDTGLGISADELPRIWDREFRGRHSRTARGLGLGLSLVRAIVEAHGGTVSAASAEGRGTVVTLRFPAFGPSHNPSAR